MPLPIICFDMDGTLLDEHGRIHPGDVAILASADPPALFIPTTGRPTGSVRRVFARGNLFLHHAIPFHMVLQNGALLLAPPGVTLAYDGLEAGVQKELLRLAYDFPQVTFLFLSAAEIYVLWPSPLGMRLAASFDFDLRPLSEADGRVVFGKVMCMSDSPSVLDSISGIVASWPVESALSMPTILEITNYHVDKGSGVTKLLEKIGLSGQPVYAAGDWGNDLPLFRIAAASFAPSTAAATIKSVASHVIDVEHDGLLHPILKLIS